MKNLNGKQNHRPEKETCSYLVKFYRLIDTVYKIISCSSLVLLCFLGGDTLNESRWDSAVDNIV